MLDKNERQYFAQEHANAVIQSLMGTFAAMGVPLAQTGPNQWSGRGSTPNYGVVPKVMVSMMPSGAGFFLDLRVMADIDTNAIVIAIVLWLVFFPAALIVGLMAYQERLQPTFFQAAWAPIAGRIAAPPGPSFGMPGQAGWPR